MNKPPYQRVYQGDLYKIYTDPHDGTFTVLLYVGKQSNEPEVIALEKCPLQVQVDFHKKQVHPND